ncbi:hypothetical protein GHT06_006613 [Daphnia sinensis]|uniref:DUF1045 domain-containing protein n=1 Tax=Daphnia sinensis TaxID=1820382 RepID=A0AAD5KTD7_9CRUS|nr:hypothetical protein GHT06_006643 [Daphnia sinensis]KAI9549314.1 hypothetical protein GHT06_006613 [Daphnia sinensis]
MLCKAAVPSPRLLHNTAYRITCARKPHQRTAARCRRCSPAEPSQHTSGAVGDHVNVDTKTACRLNTHACTTDPRRYGWHATLKAPFTLANGQSLDALRTAMRELAKGLPAFDLPPLRVSTLGQFLALRPDGDTTHINATRSGLRDAPARSGAAFERSRTGTPPKSTAHA